MCFRCELRDRAAAGDEDAVEMLNLLSQDQLATIWPLMVGELMRKLDLTTFTIDMSGVDVGHFSGLMINRADEEFTVQLVRPSELEVVKDLAAGLLPHTVN